MIALLFALTMQPSLTMELLQAEADRDPAAMTSLEDVKGAADEGFDKKPAAVQAATKPDSYHFKGATPVQGISIYTPVKDERGDEGTSRDPAKNPLEALPKYTKIAAGVGLLGLIAGFFFPPAWILGGIGIGAAAVLWFIGKKLKPKDD